MLRGLFFYLCACELSKGHDPVSASSYYIRFWAIVCRAKRATGVGWEPSSIFHRLAIHYFMTSEQMPVSLE